MMGKSKQPAPGGMPLTREDDDNWRSPENPAARPPQAWESDGVRVTSDGTDFTGNSHANRRADDTSKLRFEDEHRVPPGRNDRPHAGHLGLQPDDATIRDDVRRALSGDPDLDATGIEVTVDAGAVTLTGTVPDRGQRSAAEDCIAERPGVIAVHNQLQVDRGAQEPPDAVGR
jgi:hypothetical protein